MVGLFGSTVLVWHATFAVNSLAYTIGRRRYDTPDTSRNSALVAAATLGEGWYNNHHRHPAAARQGHAWWDLDTTFLALRLLATLGVVRDLRPCPALIRADALRPQARSHRR